MPLYKKRLITENADGFQIDAGTTSERELNFNGGDLEIQAAGTAEITFPSTDSTLATTDLAETLQNKTLSTGTAIDLGSDATGDLYYRNSSGDVARLAIGSSGQFLAVSTGLPSWTSGSVPYRTMHFSGGGTSITSTRWLGHEVGETDINHAHRICPAGEIVAIYCKRENTTAEGKFRIYKNGTVDSSADTSITAGNTTNNTTGLSITFNGTTDTIAVEMEEVGAGPTSGNYFCIIYYVAANP